MEEMVERIARVMAKMDGGVVAFRDEPTEYQQHCLMHAREVLKAMREPTEAMVGVALGELSSADGEEFQCGWEKAIDEALR